MKGKVRLLAEYRNGNYDVEIYSDGTKIKTTEDDYFDADFPDSMDIKITDYCDMNCPMCHEKSTTNGKHASFEHAFLNTLRKGTELAIGGGNPLTNPEFETFLRRMKKQGVICNVTVNEKHLLDKTDYVQFLIDNKLIYGLGVSLSLFDDKTLSFAKRNSNVVFHLIIGTPQMDKIGILYNQGYKILLLGYKKFGRGKEYYSSEVDRRIRETNAKFDEITAAFKVVSFDNLALSQLDVKNKVAKDVYEECFMGDDGESTMYVDLVEEEFAVSSTSTVRYPLKDDVVSMFAVVKKKRNF